MTHDRCCPLDDAGTECTVCRAIIAARVEERAVYQRTWNENLPRIEARNWMDGYRAHGDGRAVPDWVLRDNVPLRRA